MKKQEKRDQARQALLIRHLTDKTTEAEQREVESWIQESEQNSREFLETKKILEKVDLYYHSRSFNENKAWHTVHSAMLHPQTVPESPAGLFVRKRSLTFLKYAAVAVILLATALFGYYFSDRPFSDRAIRQVSARMEDFPKELLLTDGTKISLNSNSKITYPKKFSGDYREVTLEGEAFFEVLPDPSRPFVIDAGEARIHVVGTSFNVCAYPNSENIEVVVETGIVEILQTAEKHNQTTPLLLAPGEKATLSKKDKKLLKQKNNNPNYCAWKTHSLSFENSALTDVIQILEKTYHVSIHTSGLNADELLLTAQFDSKSIDYVLDVIRITFNLELTTESDRYILTNHHQNKETP
jgi:transmembrane sensor